MEQLAQLQEEFQEKLGGVNILFLDLGSQVIGYNIMNVNFLTKQVTAKSVGCLWLNPDWSHQDKYSYVFTALSQYFWIVEKVDYIIVEQYSINPKRMSGVLVVPELCGAVKVAASENGVKVDSFLPQSWRSELGIKKDPTTKKFKEPTKFRISEFVKLPEKSTSNITNNDRETPYDVYDALGLALGWLKRMGFRNADFSKYKFNPHVQTIDYFKNN
jgi:Holliday junction resolvasome RuvABC endonuclease subunit